MNSARFQRVSELVIAAHALGESERAAFLQRECGDDIELKREVESLLAMDHESTENLGVPRLSALSPGSVAAAVASDVDHPDSIAQYRILGVLGEGGMGIVYRARQSNPDREVALKLIRPGCTSEQSLRRFQYEAHVLGMLQHPGIAHIYEAGTAETRTDSGRTITRPFFAMEFVDGEPVTDYCRSAGLDVRAKLALFARICHAVHHAHQTGIVHRDLKPGNILVDAGGRPKILDFGVARALDADMQLTTLQTGAGQLVGTLTFMSPEQVSGDPDAIDIRSDVYALGVIGFRMLTDQYPIRVDGRSIPDAARAIVDTLPERLSRIDRTLRGDLEVIFSRALEKEPAARYQSASELAADVERYLGDEPIMARRAGTIYQLVKFSKRNKALVGGTLATMLALLVGFAATSVALLEARTQRDLATAGFTRADTEAEKTNAVNAFLQDMLSSVNPARARGEEVTVRTVLEQAAERIEQGSLREQPQVEAAVRLTIGNTFGALGDYRHAELHLAEALRLERDAPGGSNLAVARYADALGALVQATGDYRRAATLFEDALELRLRELDDDDPEIGTSYLNIALAKDHLGDIPAARVALQKALDIRLRHYGEEDVGVANVKFHLAALLKRFGDRSAAEKLYREALAVHRTVLGNDHPQTLMDLTGLGSLLRASGKPGEAKAVYEEALTAGRKVYGDNHPAVALILNNLGVLFSSQGQYERALELHTQALEIRRSVHGDNSAAAASSIHNLARIYFALGQPEKAETLFRQAIDIRTKALGDRHPALAESHHGLAGVLEAHGRREEAVAHLQTTLSIFQEKLPMGHWKTGVAATTLGSALVHLGRYEQAEPLLKQGYDAVKNNPSARPAVKADARRKLVELYESWDRPDQAEKYRHNAAPAGTPD